MNGFGRFLSLVVLSWVFFFFSEKGTDEEQFLCFNFSVSQLICAMQVDSGAWPEVGIA